MKTVLILHGAIGASDQLIPIENLFRSWGIKTVRHDFTGHGGKSIPKAPFSIEMFANDVIRRMDDENIPAADIFGYSMGGYVGLHLAKHHSDRIGKVMTVATKLEWDEAASAKEIKMLDPSTIEQKVPAFADTLKKRHGAENWKSVLNKTAEMMIAMGKRPALTESDFQSINSKVLMTVGDRDKMVSVEETLHVFRMIPDASFAVFPFTPHPVEQLNMDLMSASAKLFFTG